MECHATLPAFRDTLRHDSERDFKQAGGAVGAKTKPSAKYFCRSLPLLNFHNVQDSNSAGSDQTWQSSSFVSGHILRIIHY